MYNFQVISIFSLCITLDLGTHTCEEVLWYRKWGNHAVTGLHQDPEIVWIPRKARPHWSAWSTALNLGSGRAETDPFSQKHGLWEPTWCVIAERLFQTWQTYPQLALAIEGGHNSACHILNCSHYFLGEKKAEISHWLQFGLGHWAVKSARAMGKERSRQEGEYWCRHSCRDMERVVVQSLSLGINSVLFFLILWFSHVVVPVG